MKRVIWNWSTIRHHSDTRWIRGLNLYTEWLQGRVYVCVSASVCFYHYLCLCVFQSLCRDCTVFWSHPIINTYGSSLDSGDHLVDVRLPNPPPQCPSLSLSLSQGLYWKSCLSGGKESSDRWRDGKADRWILSDMTDWMDRWWLAAWLTRSLIKQVAEWVTRWLIEGECELWGKKISNKTINYYSNTKHLLVAKQMSDVVNSFAMAII